MNKQAAYVYFGNANKVYGPFLNRADAVVYAGTKGTVTLLTGNDILFSRGKQRIKVSAPYRVA